MIKYYFKLFFYEPKTLICKRKSELSPLKQLPIFLFNVLYTKRVSYYIMLVICEIFEQKK